MNFVELILSDVVQGNSFDPRSILPDTKSKKTLARLQEASSANKVFQSPFLSIQLSKVGSIPALQPATLQPTTFNCIDGVSRTFHPLPLKPTALNNHRPSASQPSARVLFCVDATREAPREQFTAFGIEVHSVLNFMHFILKQPRHTRRKPSMMIYVTILSSHHDGVPKGITAFAFTHSTNLNTWRM